MSREHPSRLGTAIRRVRMTLGGSGWPGRLACALGAPRHVEVTEHEICPAGWPPGAPPLRIAFGADFHAGSTTRPDLLANACATLDGAGAHVLLLGGDFVTLHARSVDAIAERFGGISAPLGRFAVLGNHDYAADPHYIARRLEAVGVQVLINANVRLPPPFEHVWICGIDEWGCGEPDAERTFAGAEGIRVVLMHRPSSLLDIDEARWDLALCGHTHGGQIALPGGVPVVLPRGPLARRYSRGRFPIRDRGTLIVSRGIGAVQLPFRAFSDPEVVFCTLSSPSRADEARVLAGASSRPEP